MAEAVSQTSLAQPEDKASARSSKTPANLSMQRYLRLFERLTPLISCKDYSDVCVKSCELIAEMLAVDACSLMVVADSGAYLRLAAATHIAAEHWDTITTPIVGGAAGHVIQTGDPLLINTAREFRKYFGRDPDTRYRTPSCAVIPLRVNDRLHGVINVAHPREQRSFHRRDVSLLESAAALIANALGSAIQAREAREMQTKLAEIFDSLHVGILTVDSQLRVRHGNSRALKLFGLEAKLPANLALSNALPWAVYNTCLRLLDASSADAHENSQATLDVRLNGHQRKLQITASRADHLPHSDSLLMFDDVSKDEEVKRLREADQMKRNFMAIISHELRTPLAVIRGSIPMLRPPEDKPVDPAILTRVHSLLTKNCHRLTEVVNSILDVTEIESGTLCLNRRDVAANDLLREAVEAYGENAAAKKLNWDLDLEADLVPIHADGRRLGQVLREMIHNAIKFSAMGESIHIKSRRQGDYVELELSNTGVRIEGAMRETIFEKFYQCDQSSTRAVGGCGLGLFLAQNIIRLHGGTISLLEDSGNQTTFLLRLPIAAETADAACSGDAPPAP
jgi:signal transduction histidine kinase